MSDGSQDTPLATMFVALYCETLAVFVALVVTGFFGFHVWLVARNMSTIEFCEKQVGGAICPRSSSARSLRGVLREAGSCCFFARLVLHQPPC